MSVTNFNEKTTSYFYAELPSMEISMKEHSLNAKLSVAPSLSDITNCDKRMICFSTAPIENADVQKVKHHGSDRS